LEFTDIDESEVLTYAFPLVDIVVSDVQDLEASISFFDEPNIPSTSSTTTFQEEEEGKENSVFQFYLEIKRVDLRNDGKKFIVPKRKLDEKRLRISDKGVIHLLFCRFETAKIWEETLRVCSLSQEEIDPCDLILEKKDVKNSMGLLESSIKSGLTSNIRSKNDSPNSNSQTSTSKKSIFQNITKRIGSSNKKLETLNEEEDDFDRFPSNDHMNEGNKKKKKGWELMDLSSFRFFQYEYQDEQRKDVENFIEKLLSSIG